MMLEDIQRIRENTEEGEEGEEWRGREKRAPCAVFVQ